MEINNIDELRQYAIDTLKKLSRAEISIEHAGVSGKLCENVVSTLKVQLDYAKMLKQDPAIDFLEKSTLPNGRIIEGSNEIKKLEDPSKKQINKGKK